ncbi:unnamed protein product [Lathyrus sativus]|nr:unnamed protein product [Lathyrus sativus]
MAALVIIPWLFLDSFSPKTPSCTSNSKVSTTSKKSFIEAVNNVCDIPISQLPHSIIKGDHISITIPEDEYMAGLESCKHNLHGRIIWPKGATLLKVEDLKKKLSDILSSLGKWGLTSLGSKDGARNLNTTPEITFSSA